MARTTKPPPPIVFFLWLVIVVGVVLLFAEGGGHTVGIAMIITGGIALLARWITQARKPHHKRVTAAHQSQRHSHNARH